jgi:hypothetical protein
LTASKTEAETNATTRVVTRGLELAVITVLFIIPIHCSTGSGAAATAKMGLPVSMPASKVINGSDWLAERKRFAIDTGFPLIQGCTNALLTFAFPRVSNQSPH